MKLNFYFILVVSLRKTKPQLWLVPSMMNGKSLFFLLSKKNFIKIYFNVFFHDSAGKAEVIVTAEGSDGDFPWDVLGGKPDSIPENAPEPDSQTVNLCIFHIFSIVFKHIYNFF